ncbi:mRNA cleavage and polyadenylation specificity factor-like protein [Nanohaloarchaea archaeon]|nr:mRNA cleavage and polyadenylation specificity factor-like protein [Candidatus Nanohaloarchaea archaeon]
MIREKDGIHFNLNDREVVADSTNATGDLNIVSHAHFDHLHQSGSQVVCSELTAKLTKERTGEEIDRLKEHSIELIPSGHILGSTSALFGEEKKHLYTGDVSMRKTAYLEGFNPVSADFLVVESTYGVPAYTFPDQKQVESRIKDFVQDNRDQPLYLFGYSLGKAQKIQKIIEDVVERPVLAHGAVKKMNDAVEDCTDMSFQAKSYRENKQKLEDENAILVAPSRSSQADWIEKNVERYGGVKAGFSGWAARSSFKFRGGYDETFILSDHCDFDELIDLVRQVDPEEVYTHHGFDEELASHLSNELGYSARALKQNQTSLGQFQ